jgi:hypothetical protein
MVRKVRESLDGGAAYRAEEGLGDRFRGGWKRFLAGFGGRVLRFYLE